MLIFEIDYTIEVRDDENTSETYQEYRSIYVISETIAKAVDAFEKENPTAKINSVDVLRNVLIA